MTTLAVGNVTRLVKKRSHTSFLPIPPHANHTALIQSALRPAQRRRCADSPQPEGHCTAPPPPGKYEHRAARISDEVFF
jgi:hypothetical protein